MQTLSQLALLLQTPAPTDQALQLLLRSIIISIMKRLVRQGVLVQAQDQWYVADTVAEDTDTSALRPLQHAQLFTALPLAPRAGRKVLTLREAMPIDTETDYEAKDPMARWHHASSDVAVGVYAKARGAGAKTTPSLNPISWSAGTECEVALKGSAAGVK